jgi:hypothetical protein
MQQAPSRALEEPAIASYRFKALKVSHGGKHHGIVTSNDGCDGRMASQRRRVKIEIKSN